MKSEKEMFIVLLVVIILGLIANQLSNIHLNFILVILICAGIAYILRLFKNLYEYWKKQKIRKNKIRVIEQHVSHSFCLLGVWGKRPILTTEVVKAFR
ncbi:hypothetical protein [Lactococcus lactis]|uniref:hypothetical protein n=1 Tax=Lactococcus lactis TaxID=1358 RepID=UPI00040B6FEA|nr:hypothetical protein [Lactococcus lactis]